MRTSPIEFRGFVLDRLLALLWRQWSAIGVPGYSSARESNVVDPEALLLLTLSVGRYDMRLFDEILTWLQSNGSLLNVQRLQNLARQSGDETRAVLGAVAEILAGRKTSALKWERLASRQFLDDETPLFFMLDGRPMPTPVETDETFRRHGLIRPPVEAQQDARPFPPTGMPSLLLRLRALIGVSARCEILCLLGSTAEMHPSLMARLIGQAPRTIQKLLAEMAQSGVVQVRTGARAKSYALAPGALESLLGPGGSTPWLYSVPLFRACGRLWTGLADPGGGQLEPVVLASQWRRLMREVRPSFAEAERGQLLRNESAYPGEEYCDVFVEDVKGTMEVL